MPDTSHLDEGPTDEQIAVRTRQLETVTTLSAREAEVAALKEYGMTHAEIADRIGVEKSTVDSHVHRIKVKYSTAHHTKNELAAAFEGEVPDPADYTGYIFYYDPTNDFHTEVLLPAARASGAPDDDVEIQVTDSAKTGGILHNQPVEHTPAWVFCEGEPLRQAEGTREVLRNLDMGPLDTQTVQRLGYQLGYFDPETGEWDIGKD